MAEATPGIVNSGENTWNGGGGSIWAMAYGMGNSLGTPSSKESRGMTEATPGTTNSGNSWNGRGDSRHHKQWGKRGMAEAIPGTINSGENVEWQR